jgi:ribulose-phosphate 3-epimerase
MKLLFNLERLLPEKGLLNERGFVEIYPSLISSDILNLENVIKTLDDHCDGYHIDVMDNHFVPNLTWGSAFIKRFLKVIQLPLDVHLMVDDTIDWIDKFELRDIDTFIFHYESFNDINEINHLIKVLQKKEWKFGIAINPKTSVEKIENFLPLLSQVLIMSVEPGFSGQKFIDSVIKKVEDLSNIKNKKSFTLKICMDGGIGIDNVRRLSEIGVERIGVASSVFTKGNPVENLKTLYRNTK